MQRHLAQMVVATAALAATLAVAPSAAASNDASRAAEAFRAGQGLERDGELAAACARYAEAARWTPSWGLARYELAQCLRLVGDFDRAAAEHIAAAEGDLQRPPIYVEMGRIAEDAGDAEAAAAAYAEALAIEPAEVRALTGLVRLARPADPEALARVQAHVERAPDDLAALRKLAALAEAAGSLEVAEAALREVMARSARPRAAAAGLGAFAQRTGRAGALADARRAMARAR